MEDVADLVDVQREEKTLRPGETDGMEISLNVVAERLVVARTINRKVFYV